MKVRINKHFLRQMLAILLCVAMVFTHSSFTALAEEPEGGSEFTEPGGEEDAAARVRRGSRRKRANGEQRRVNAS